MNQIDVNVTDVKVEWLGTTKPQLIKEGPKAGTYTEARPSVQLSYKNQDGHVIVFYANSKDPFPQSLKVGDVVDMRMRVRAFKDGLYCDVIKVNQNGGGSAVSSVSGKGVKV